MGCGVDVLLSSCGYGGGVPVPIFLIGSAGRGVRRFIQLDFSYSHSRGHAYGVMVLIWDEMMEREKPMR